MVRPAATDRWSAEKTPGAWAAESLERRCADLASRAPGDRHAGLYAAARQLGAYCAAGYLPESEIVARLETAAAAAGMGADRRKEVSRTIRAGLDAGRADQPWYPDAIHGVSAAVRVVEFLGRTYRIAVGQRAADAIQGWAGARLPGRAVEDAFQVWVTYYRGKRITAGAGRLWDLEMLQAAIREPLDWPAEGKDGLPLWGWHRIEDSDRARRRVNVRADGSAELRDPRIDGVSAVALDYDAHDGWSLEWVRQRFGHLFYAAHSTASHQTPKGDSPAIPRGRVILPLAREVTEEEYRGIVRYLRNADLGPVAAEELVSPRRAYFLPARAPGGYAGELNIAGEWLDPDRMLAELASVDAAPEVESRAWAQLEMRTETKAKDTGTNLAAIFRNDPEFAGRVRLNTFTATIELDGRPLEDADLTAISHAVNRIYGFEPSAARVAEVIALIARENVCHPVQAWLRGLAWDGVPRLDQWLRATTGCTGILDGVYGRKMLLSMVARALKPGCKVDTVLILVGPQGSFKSTLMKLLGGPWFRDTTLSLGDKDAFVQLRGVWLYELSELDSINRRDWSAVKAFITSQSDDYRPAYARNLQSFPRQCVFVGTTNDASFLSDSTGSRRFLPVRISRRADLDWLRQHRDQLFAEAVTAIDAGEEWWLTADQDALREELAGEYQAQDPWQETIEGVLIGRSSASISELGQRIGVRLEDLDSSTEKRIARILSSIGWVRERRVREGGGRVWQWGPARR